MGYLGRTPAPSPVTADDIPANSIDASKIIDGAIAVADVADNAITEAKIADAAVVSLKSGRKNLIINGDMQVSQRGDYTSATTAVNANYYLDRHQANFAGVTTTVQHTDVTINGIDKKALRVAATSTATGFIASYQPIEFINLQVGETYIVSCFVRSNNPNTRFRHDSMGGVSGADSPAFTNDGNWEKVSWVLDSTGTVGNINIYVLSYNSGNVSITTGDYIEFTELQLEVGSVATDFEHRSYGEELALCQRYYQAYGRASSGTPFRVVGSGNGGNTMLTGFLFQEKMRSAPTIAYYGGGSTSGSWNNYTNGTATSNSSSTVTADVGDSSVRWNFAGNGSNPGSAYWIDVGIGGSQLGFTLDAEL